MTPRFASSVAALVALLLGAPALAEDTPGDDAPTATAPAAPVQDPSTADQIAAFLRDSPVARLPADAAPSGVTPGAEPRRPHGVVDVAVGSHGYRSVYVRSDLPVGQTGTLSIAVGESRGGRGFGPGFGYGPGYFAGRGLPLGATCRSGVAMPAERDCPARSGASPILADDDGPAAPVELPR